MGGRQQHISHHTKTTPTAPTNPAVHRRVRQIKAAPERHADDLQVVVRLNEVAALVGADDIGAGAAALCGAVIGTRV